MIIHDVEQNTEAWELIRAGKPTASEFKKLITSTGAPSKSMSAYAIELAGEMYAGKPLNTWAGNQYTEYGHDTEDQARSAYEMRQDVDVTQVGFCTDDNETVGCSPDGMVGDDGLLEIKCLPKNHIPALLYWKTNEKPPTDYVAQVQGQLLITGKKWCDLVFYRPELPMLIIRITPDTAIQSGLQRQLQACLAERDSVLKVLQEF